MPNRMGRFGFASILWLIPGTGTKAPPGQWQSLVLCTGGCGTHTEQGLAPVTSCPLPGPVQQAPVPGSCTSRLSPSPGQNANATWAKEIVKMKTSAKIHGISQRLYTSVAVKWELKITVIYSNFLRSIELSIIPMIFSFSALLSRYSLLISHW